MDAKNRFFPSSVYFKTRFLRRTLILKFLVSVKLEHNTETLEKDTRTLIKKSTDAKFFQKFWLTRFFFQFLVSVWQIRWKGSLRKYFLIWFFDFLYTYQFGRFTLPCYLFYFRHLGRELKTNKKKFGFFFQKILIFDFFLFFFLQKNFWTPKKPHQIEHTSIILRRF